MPIAARVENQAARRGDVARLKSILARDPDLLRYRSVLDEETVSGGNHAGECRRTCLLRSKKTHACTQLPHSPHPGGWPGCTPAVNDVTTPAPVKQALN